MLYLAEYNQGATVNGHVLNVADLELHDSLSSFSTNYTPRIDYQQLALKIYSFLVQNTRNVRTTNSLVDLLNVAEGRFGGCVIMFNGMWDIAAPVPDHH